MISRDVVFTPDARGDLIEIYDWISEAASPAVAMSFVGRIERYLAGFDIGATRGTPRDDVRPGLRIVGFERRLTIAFTVTDKTVTVLRIFYGGRNWNDVLSES